MCARTPTHSPAAGGDGEGDSDNDDDDFFTTLRPCDTPAQSHSDACRASYSHKSTSCSSPYPPSLCMHTLTPSSLPANSRQQPGSFQRRNTSSSHGRPSQGRRVWLAHSNSLAGLFCLFDACLLADRPDWLLYFFFFASACLHFFSAQLG